MRHEKVEAFASFEFADKHQEKNKEIWIFNDNYSILFILYTTFFFSASGDVPTRIRFENEDILFFPESALKETITLLREIFLLYTLDWMAKWQEPYYIIYLYGYIYKQMIRLFRQIFHLPLSWYAMYLYDSTICLLVNRCSIVDVVSCSWWCFIHILLVSVCYI